MLENIRVTLHTFRHLIDFEVIKAGNDYLKLVTLPRHNCHRQSPRQSPPNNILYSPATSRNYPPHHRKISHVKVSHNSSRW